MRVPQGIVLEVTGGFSDVRGTIAADIEKGLRPMGYRVKIAPSSMTLAEIADARLSVDVLILDNVLGLQSYSRPKQPEGGALV